MLIMLPIRIGVAMVLCALIAFAFMRFAYGSAMFCIDPPAADPGWEWKVPFAWITIYGVSTFLSIFITSIRARHWTIPGIVSFYVIVAFVIIRSRHFYSQWPYWSQKEATWGFPAMLIAAVVAVTLAAIMNKK